MNVIYLLMEKIPDKFWESPSIRRYHFGEDVCWCCHASCFFDPLHSQAIHLCCHTAAAVYSDNVVVVALHFKSAVMREAMLARFFKDYQSWRESQQA